MCGVRQFVLSNIFTMQCRVVSSIVLCLSRRAVAIAANASLLSMLSIDLCRLILLAVFIRLSALLSLYPDMDLCIFCFARFISSRTSIVSYVQLYRLFHS